MSVVVMYVGRGDVIVLFNAFFHFQTLTLPGSFNPLKGQDKSKTNGELINCLYKHKHLIQFVFLLGVLSI